MTENAPVPARSRVGLAWAQLQLAVARSLDVRMPERGVSRRGDGEDRVVEVRVLLVLDAVIAFVQDIDDLADLGRECCQFRLVEGQVEVAVPELAPCGDADVGVEDGDALGVGLAVAALRERDHPALVPERRQQRLRVRACRSRFTVQLRVRGLVGVGADVDAGAGGAGAVGTGLGVRGPQSHRNPSRLVVGPAAVADRLVPGHDDRDALSVISRSANTTARSSACKTSP